MTEMGVKGSGGAGSEPAMMQGAAVSDFRMQMRHYGMLGVLLLILAGVMVYPVYQGIAQAFLDKGRVSLYWIANVLGDATFRGQLLTSLGLGLTVTVLCNLIAFPLALIGARYEFRGKGILAAMVLVPM